MKFLALFVTHLLPAFASVLLVSCSKEPAPTTAQSAVQPQKVPETPGAAAERAGQTVKNLPNFENTIAYGLALAAADRHEEAAVAYISATKINPDAALAFNNACAEYNTLRRWKLAAPFCKRAVELQPSFQLAKNNLAFALNNKESSDKAIRETESKLAAFKGEEREVQVVQLGMMSYNQGDYARAIEVWKKVPAKSKQYATALNNIASALILLKNYDEADSKLKAALQLDPKSLLFQNNMKWLEQARASHQ